MLDIMLELTRPIREDYHLKVKVEYFSRMLQHVEKVCKRMKEAYPDMVIDELVATYRDMAEQSAMEHATLEADFVDTIIEMSFCEMNSYAQTKTTPIE